MKGLKFEYIGSFEGSISRQQRENAENLLEKRVEGADYK